MSKPKTVTPTFDVKYFHIDEEYRVILRDGPEGYDSEIILSTGATAFWAIASAIGSLNRMKNELVLRERNK